MLSSKKAKTTELNSTEEDPFQGFVSQIWFCLLEKMIAVCKVMSSITDGIGLVSVL